MSTATESALEGDYEADDPSLIDDNFEDAQLEPVSEEARARAMGWKPLAEFKGDIRRWTDAAAFIAHGEAELPILRDQSRRMSEKLVRQEGEISALRNTVTEQTKAIQDAMKLARRADDNGYQRGLAELKAKQRVAVETGDTVVYDQVQAQIDAAERERQAAAAPEPDAPVAPAPKPDIWPETTAFLAANPWFQTDAQLHNAMVAAHNAVLNLHPNVDRAEQYEMAKDQVIQAYPAKFPEDTMPRAPAPAPAPRQRPRASVADPSPPPAPRRPGASPFDQIEDAEDRAAVREAYNRVKTWDPDTTAEEYVSLYLNPKQNPIDLRAQRKRK